MAGTNCAADKFGQLCQLYLIPSCSFINLHFFMGSVFIYLFFIYSEGDSWQKRPAGTKPTTTVHYSLSYFC